MRYALAAAGLGSVYYGLLARDDTEPRGKRNGLCVMLGLVALVAATLLFLAAPAWAAQVSDPATQHPRQVVTQPDMHRAAPHHWRHRHVVVVHHRHRHRHARHRVKH